MTKRRFLLEDFEKALEQLKEALNSPKNSDLEKAGCIQYFEFCFELAWKTVQAVSTEEGLPDCLSPKACLKQAFAQGWIDDEKIWLDMLEARNRMSHTYNAADALTIYDSLKSYLPALQKLAGRLRSVH